MMLPTKGWESGLGVGNIKVAKIDILILPAIVPN